MCCLTHKKLDLKPTENRIFFASIIASNKNYNYSESELESDSNSTSVNSGIFISFML